MELLGTAKTVLDPCDCEGNFHAGHVRHLEYRTVRNSWKMRRRGGPKHFQSVYFHFTLDGHKIPRWLGHWLAHRKMFGKRLVHYDIHLTHQETQP